MGFIAIFWAVLSDEQMSMSSADEWDQRRRTPWPVGYVSGRHGGTIGCSSYLCRRRRRRMPLVVWALEPKRLMTILCCPDIKEACALASATLVLPGSSISYVDMNMLEQLSGGLLAIDPHIAEWAWPSNVGAFFFLTSLVSPLPATCASKQGLRRTRTCPQAMDIHSPY